MVRRGGSASQSKLTFDDAVEQLEPVLGSGVRGEITEQVLKPGDLRESLRRLRTAMRSHTFRTASGRRMLSGLMEALDKPTRRDGFHVMHAWDPELHRFTSEANPVLMLDYLARTGVGPRSDRAAIALLLDCYLLYLVALLVMRVWDHADPNRGLDRVTALLGELQGPAGSQHQFVESAEMLLLLATSQYQPEEAAYDRLLERVRALDDEHRVRLALVGAPNLGSHLRWGFQFMYRMDVERMRADNVVDYPWLLFCLSTLMRAYARIRDSGEQGQQRHAVVEALLNGLTADPQAFVGEAPACLSTLEAERSSLRDGLRQYAEPLRQDFELCRPAAKSYSPIAFQFNFLHNTLVAKVATALLQETAPNLPLDALLRGERGDGPRIRSEILARMLMDFAAADPSRRGARGSILTVYDPADARRSFEATLRTLEGLS